MTKERQKKRKRLRAALQPSPPPAPKFTFTPTFYAAVAQAKQRAQALFGPKKNYTRRELRIATRQLQAEGFCSTDPGEYFEEDAASGAKGADDIAQAAALTFWQKLQQWDVQTKQPGRHGGGIGLTAMAVLQYLIFPMSELDNWPVSPRDPSYDAIQKATGLCRQAVADALKKLKALRILNNAYAILPPSQWLGYNEPPTAPPPDPDAGLVA
jgi:hypothetical protein